MKTLEPTNRTDTQSPTEFDATSAIPWRPRFVRELLLATVEHGVVVDGADQLHVLWGETTKSLLPTLIPLMDGSRTLSELDGALPHLPAQQVRAAVWSLFQWGLVEDGNEDTTPDLAINTDTLAFFRRYIGTTGINRNGREAYGRLLATDVVIVTSDEVTQAVQQLKTLLERTGVRQVFLLDQASFESWLSAKEKSNQSLLVSLSLGSEDYEMLARVDDLCSASMTSWLRVVFDQRKSVADIGPMFNRREVPCYRCFYHVHSRNDHHGSSEDEKPSSEDMQFWVSMVATELVYFLSRIAPLPPAGALRRYDLEHSSSKTLRFPGIPGCCRCRPLYIDAQTHVSVPQGVIDTALVFEEYVSTRSRPLATARTSETESATTLDLTKQTKRLPNCQQYNLARDLPALRRSILDASLGDVSGAQTLRLNELAAMLLMTAGIRSSRNHEDTVKRWAATGGNLGSVELFVAVRDVDGLSPGYYFYQPREHSLAHLRRRSRMLPIEEFMSRTISGDSANLPDALVLFTAAYHRVSLKYGPFGYRLINLDAGVALSQLHLLARCMGLRSHTAVRWADDLIEDQLRLESMSEQSTAVALIYRKQNRELPPHFGHLKLRTGVPASSKAARYFCDMPVPEVAALAYRESRMTESELNLGAFPVPDELQARDPANSDAVPLPAPSGGGGFVGDILRARTSIRRYTDKPMSLDQISTILSFAHAADVSEWPEEHLKGQALSFFLLAQCVAGLKAGVFIYKPVDSSLRFLREPPCSQAAAQLYVQDEFASAPAAIWIVGNLAAACARHGAFGHRQLMLRAGAAGNRLWMAALGIGLAGSLVAGVVAGTARRELGLDGYLKAALLAVTIGHAPTQIGPAVDFSLMNSNQRT
jgi:SagB-type dehydrogenase family enzyme